MTQVSFSYQLTSVLRRFFEEKSYSTPTFVGNNDSTVRFNNHNFNPVFLRISVNQEGKVHEVPSIIRDYETVEGYSIFNREVGELVTPLSILDSQTRRTADSIFKYFFSPSRHGYSNYVGLKKAETSKGEVYYGAPGLILDHNFEPIVIGISEYTGDGVVKKFERHVLKVNPNVFLSDGLLEKAIIKKLIPFYTRYDVEGRTVRVEVDNISKYIVKPVPPKGRRIQESLKGFLSTYKEEILENIL